MFALFWLALTELIAGSTIFTIVGRILLPEIGLHAPSFWIWFWVFFFLAILDFIKGVIKEFIS